MNAEDLTSVKRVTPTLQADDRIKYRPLAKFLGKSKHSINVSNYHDITNKFAPQKTELSGSGESPQSSFPLKFD